MALTDRKIPIITGVNDVPSETGGASHPNASLLCKQYNDLIDNELNELGDYKDFTGDTTLIYSSINYIDVVSKVELLEALNDLPSKVVGATIQVQNDLADTFNVLDFKKFVTLFVESYGFGVQGFAQFDLSYCLQILGVSSARKIKIESNTTNLSPSSNTTSVTPYSNIYAPQGVYFNNIYFEKLGVDSLVIQNSIVLFEDCTFDSSVVTEYINNMLLIINSKVCFLNCTFKWTDSQINNLIQGLYSDIFIQSLTLINPTGSSNVAGNKCHFSFRFIEPARFNFVGSENVIFLKRTSGAVVTDYFSTTEINENIIKDFL